MNVTTKTFTVSEQFLQIGQILQEQIQNAQQAKTDMDSCVLQVKAKAEEKLRELDVVLKKEIEKALQESKSESARTNTAIAKLTEALNKFSLDVRGEVRTIQQELSLAVTPTQSPEPPATKLERATVAQRLTACERKLKEIESYISQVKAAGANYFEKETSS